ncbi:MAG: RNA polymerase sigma factor [Opitutaceae bacterium]|nr:RNA polymerase sigma factor [Opitutaceae bacterium]
MALSRFQDLVDNHYEALFRFGVSLSGNVSDAADLTQQTFFIWAKKGHALRDRSKAKSWLFTTLYREFLKNTRRSQRFVYQEEQMLENKSATIEAGAIENLDAEIVIESLSKIEEAFRIPLSLFYLEDFSYKRISETLNIPVGTVMSRLSRGKKHLRKLLDDSEITDKGKIIPITSTQKTQNSHG